MEIVLDEFIIDWHLSNEENERETAESLIRTIKKMCHRLVFDYRYLDRFKAKLRDVKKQRRKDTYITLVLIKRLGSLFYNSKKLRVCNGQDVDELNSVKDDLDKLVVRSALCIKDTKKLFVTTDPELVEEAEALEKYGIKGVLAEKAEEVLMKNPCQTSY